MYNVFTDGHSVAGEPLQPIFGASNQFTSSYLTLFDSNIKHRSGDQNASLISRDMYPSGYFVVKFKISDGLQDGFVSPAMRGRSRLTIRFESVNIFFVASDINHRT